MTNIQNLQLQKAERNKVKIKIGLFGPSGSGKTFSALLLAHGITKDWKKIAVIDTENNSASLYAHLGEYNVLNLTPPFEPERYIQAINACESAGAEVIIIDSISHEWEGKGGCLEIVDKMGRDAKNSFTVWAKMTPRHNAFIDAILRSPVHVICCGRSKQDYVLNQVEKQGRMINVPEKIGLKAVTREGFDYEMTLAFDLAMSHYATSSKDRTGLFMGKPEFIIGEATGQTIVEWNEGGTESEEDKKKTARIEDIRKMLKILKAKEKFVEDQVGKPLHFLSLAALDKVFTDLDAIRIKREEEKTGKPVIECDVCKKKLTSAEVDVCDNAETGLRMEVDGKEIKYACEKCFPKPDVKKKDE